MKPKSFPRVIVNFIITADGKVSTRNWTPSGFGSLADQKRLQLIRSWGDALMVGRKTAEIDNMALGISAAELRLERQAMGKPREPLRVLVSGSGHLNLRAKIFSLHRSPLVIFTSVILPLKIQRALPAGIIVHTLIGEKFFLKKILEILRHHYHVRTLVCEGGPTLMRSLLEMDMVMQVNLTITPLVFGGYQAPTLTGLPGDFLPRALNFQLKSMEVQEGDCFLTYERKRNIHVYP